MPLKGKSNLKVAFGELKQSANLGVRAVFMDGLGKIIEGTPVGLTISEVGSSSTSGLTKNNWFLTEGAPSSATTSTKSKGGTGSFEQLTKMPKNVLGKKLFFTNNKDHIGLLEYGGYPSPVKKGSWTKTGYQILSIGGFSGQVAPKGWVRVAIIAMQSKIRKI